MGDLLGGLLLCIIDPSAAKYGAVVASAILKEVVPLGLKTWLAFVWNTLWSAEGSRPGGRPPNWDPIREPGCPSLFAKGGARKFRL